MTFQTKDGTKYTVEHMHTWTTISGKQVTSTRVNVSNPNTGHGWSGIMNADQIDYWRTR
jgi:hypothetical protein